MIQGSLPPATVWGTWSENIEIISNDDDELVDLVTDVVEITLTVRDPRGGWTELSLTLTNGDITVPSTGIIQWRVEKDQMGTLLPKLYEVILQIEHTDGTVLPLILGPLSVVE